MRLRLNFLRELVRSLPKSDFRHIRLFIVQHLYSDTLEFIKVLKDLEVAIDVVIGIAYSNQPEIINNLSEMGLQVLTPSADEMELVVREELIRSLDKCRHSNQKLIIHEVGGYVVPISHTLLPDQLALIAGAIEDTKQGKWRVEQIGNLAYPYFHCAESKLKQLEAPFVGDAIGFILDSLLKQHGYALAGRRVLVIGYGWIGSAVCNSLRCKKAIVMSYDIDPIRRLAAQLDGIQTFEKSECPGDASIVIGASGQTSVTGDIIEKMRDNTIIASASSRNIEIDLSYLRNMASEEIRIAPEICQFTMKNGKKLYLLNDGFPINFLGTSLPDEISDLLLGEIMLMIHTAATGQYSPGIYAIGDSVEKSVASIWLSSRMKSDQLNPNISDVGNPLCASNG